MNDPTIEAPVYPEFHPLLEARRNFIESTLASGKVVRFHYPYPAGNWKDIDRFEPDEMGDLKSFRRNGGASEWVCWSSPILTLTAEDY